IKQDFSLYHIGFEISSWSRYKVNHCDIETCHPNRPQSHDPLLRIAATRYGREKPMPAATRLVSQRRTVRGCRTARQNSKDRSGGIHKSPRISMVDQDLSYRECCDPT